ncbi:hypothetical protein [Butyricimonas faecihominis]
MNFNNYLRNNSHCRFLLLFWCKDLCGLMGLRVIATIIKFEPANLNGAEKKRGKKGRKNPRTDFSPSVYMEV